MVELVLDERLEIILTNSLSKSGSLRYSLGTKDEVDSSSVALVVLLQHNLIITSMLLLEVRSDIIYSL